MGARKRLERLSRAPPFSELRLEIVRALAGAATGRMATRGTVVFRTGDDAASAYVVDRGAVRICSVTEDGRPVVFRLAGPGEVFGLLPLLDGASRSAEAQAVTDARLVCVPYTALAEHLERSAPVAAAFARHAAATLRRERGRLANLMCRDIPDRLGAVLAELGESHGVPVAAGVLIDVPLRHEDLAGLIGTTRETVTRVMSSLVAGGRLRRMGERYVLLDPARAHVASLRGA